MAGRWPLGLIDVDLNVYALWTWLRQEGPNSMRKTVAEKKGGEEQLAEMTSLYASCRDEISKADRHRKL